MKKRIDPTESLLSRAAEDSDFRELLLARPREAIERELGVSLDEDREIRVHEESRGVTHLVLPPRGKFSAAEREEARTGTTSLEFLRKTMYDPAPPPRPTPAVSATAAGKSGVTSAALAKACGDSIRRGLDFLESEIDENGAWRCVRFNTADPEIPRHWEKPPFITAYCALALECCDEPRAGTLRDAARTYLADTVEYPGFWRYYRHVPLDLDSTTLCSLVIDDHPWIALGRNIPRMLANRDQEGRFLTWLHAEDEPDVAAPFRIEADPVVNANVIACLGDRPETAGARRWLESLVIEDRLEGSSKWYPDSIAIIYAIVRAMARARPAFDRLRPILADRVLDLRDDTGEFGNVLGAAQAVSALHGIGSLERIDAKRAAEALMGLQRQDGSWPELLAFGDQYLKWGVAGRTGHGGEAVTSAFCIEALERLAGFLGARA